MKTFNKSDLITWSNLEKAEVGKRYYCADSLNELLQKINSNAFTNELTGIHEDSILTPFRVKRYDEFESFSCLLPMDKVIEEPEKKYRRCENIEELYFVVFNHFPRASMKIGNIARNLIDSIHHIRNKRSGNEYYTYINSFSLEELFDEFEIEINGKWMPFGIEETETEE